MKIDELYASAYQSAVESTASALNEKFGTALSFKSDWAVVEEIAVRLGIRFNAYCEIVKGE